jgi:hypothetical protein
MKEPLIVLQTYPNPEFSGRARHVEQPNLVRGGCLELARQIIELDSDSLRRSNGSRFKNKRRRLVIQLMYTAVRLCQMARANGFPVTFRDTLLSYAELG